MTKILLPLILLFVAHAQAQSKPEVWTVQATQSITGQDKSGQMVEIDLSTPGDGFWRVSTSGMDNSGQSQFDDAPVHTQIPDGDQWVLKAHGVGSNHVNEIYTYVLKQTYSNGGHLQLKMPSGFVTEMRSANAIL